MNDLGKHPPPDPDADDAPVAAGRAPAPPNLRHDIAAWTLMGVALLFVLQVHLLPALFMGLLMHELVHLLTPQLRLRRVSVEVSKAVAVLMLSAIIIGLVALAVSGLMVSMRNGYDALPDLLQRMAEIIEARRDSWPQWLVQSLPADAAAMQQTAAAWLRDNARELRLLGANTGRALTYALFGVIIGAFVALHRGRRDEELPPLARSMAARIKRLGRSFRRVVFAQVRISAVNTVATGLYLIVILPALGIYLPLTKTMIAVTFLCGLLPILGNIISNTVIVIVSLSHSLTLAAVSLCFLVVVHKGEYFLNARIIGGQIQARAWELLVAMLAMEATFGIPGLIAAPVYYAYLKDELFAKRLI